MNKFYDYKELSHFLKILLNKFYNIYGYNNDYDLFKEWFSKEKELSEYKKYLEISEKEYKHYNNKNKFKISDLENWLDHFSYCYSKK